MLCCRSYPLEFITIGTSTAITPFRKLFFKNIYLIWVFLPNSFTPRYPVDDHALIWTLLELSSGLSLSSVLRGVRHYESI